MFMKRSLRRIIWTVAIVVVLVVVCVRGKEEWPPIELKELGVPAIVSEPVTVAFKGGERISLMVKYLGFIPAGVVRMDVKEVQYLGRETYYLACEAKSSRFFSFFCQVHSVFESYMDANNLYSLRFEEHSRAGRHADERLTVYDQESLIAETSEEGKLGSRKVKIAENTQDFLSALYFLRTRKLEEGDTFTINLNDRKKNYQVEVKVSGKEEVEIPQGRFSAYVVEVKAMRAGKREASPKAAFTIWLSDDERKLPVLIRARTSIGPIKAYLLEVKL